ncbi:hypothetical protein E4U57_006464 [Claviceps arundinis]|uniref:Uncharacterized protein n=1 Tax=Claviceps arundinis TaxID=1623583 RepID=A0ABQ7P1V2_9HYPO|nr:hypothetical protein E4U57_006464 [Claviceps arundinis]
MSVKMPTIDATKRTMRTDIRNYVNAPGLNYWTRYASGIAASGLPTVIPPDDTSKALLKIELLLEGVVVERALVATGADAGARIKRQKAGPDDTVVPGTRGNDVIHSLINHRDINGES